MCSCLLGMFFPGFKRVHRLSVPDTFDRHMPVARDNCGCMLAGMDQGLEIQIIIMMFQGHLSSTPFVLFIRRHPFSSLEVSSLFSKKHNLN